MQFFGLHVFVRAFLLLGIQRGQELNLINVQHMHHVVHKMLFAVTLVLLKFIMQELKRGVTRGFEVVIAEMVMKLPFTEIILCYLRSLNSQFAAKKR
jgi:hypothetical protein